MKQLTIAGGGLAGLALGIALRLRSVPARIVEQSGYPRHRVCGEFVSGIQPEELVALGIDDLFTLAARPRETAWFEAGRLMFKASLPEAGYGLSRHLLDGALATRFSEAGGELEIGKRFADDPTRDGTVLATGRPQQPSPWLGLKAHYQNMEIAADLEIHWGDAAYVGLTPVEDGRVNVCGLFRRTSPVSGGQHVLEHAVDDAGLTALADRLRAARMDSESLKGINHFHLGWQVHRDPAVRIGDAMAMISPFTGNGMTMALQGALCAVEPLERWSRGVWEWSEAVAAIRKSQHRLFAPRLRWARSLQWLLLHRLGRRLCSALITQRWVSFGTLYRKVR